MHNIKDEINFWTQKSNNSPTKSDKEKAKAFVLAIEELNKQIRFYLFHIKLCSKIISFFFRQFESKSLKHLTDFLDTIHTTLDDIWRLPHNYPQNRMKDLMDIICKL